MLLRVYDKFPKTHAKIELAHIHHKRYVLRLKKPTLVLKNIVNMKKWIFSMSGSS
jgi:hypothetical protein